MEKNVRVHSGVVLTSQLMAAGADKHTLLLQRHLRWDSLYHCDSKDDTYLDQGCPICSHSLCIAFAFSSNVPMPILPQSFQ